MILVQLWLLGITGAHLTLFMVKMNAGKVSSIPTEVINQILKIRDTGLTNMFDTNMVQYLADENGFYELVSFLIDHKKRICSTS